MFERFGHAECERYRAVICPSTTLCDVVQAVTKNTEFFAHTWSARHVAAPNMDVQSQCARCLARQHLNNLVLRIGGKCVARPNSGSLSADRYWYFAMFQTVVRIDCTEVYVGVYDISTALGIIRTPSSLFLFSRLQAMQHILRR
jgi:hypothetical protein